MKKNPKTCQKDIIYRSGNTDAKKHRSDGWLETVFLRAATLKEEEWLLYWII